MPRAKKIFSRAISLSALPYDDSMLKINKMPEGLIHLHFNFCKQVGVNLV
jgi:hypothetical protein